MILFCTNWRARRCPWNLQKKGEKKFKNLFWSLCYVRGTPVFPKKFSPFGPAVWPATGNIYTNVLFYYIEDRWLCILILIYCIFSIEIKPFNNKSKKYIFQFNCCNIFALFIDSVANYKIPRNWKKNKRTRIFHCFLICTVYTVLPKKHETLEMNLRNLFCPFLYIHDSLQL